MLAIIFALLSYFAWSTGDIFGTITTRKLGAYSTTFWTLLLGLIFCSFYIPFSLDQIQGLTLDIFFLNIILALIFVTSFLTYNEALRITHPSLVGPIAASFSALVVVFSVIFLKETITSYQILSILIIFLGAIISSLDFTELKKRKFTLNRGILLAIATMIIWGIYFTFIKIPVKKIGWFWPSYISFALFPLVYLFMRIRKIELKKPTYKRALLPLIMAVVILRIGDFSFNFAISKELTAIVAPIAGSYPTLFVVLSFLIFKDPIKKQQIFGIILTVVGIVLLSFLS
ncbi:DMT family transporter [Patescibacteria group bacterium]|nr:DMT family transporter [Patescibacteria group bacterium]